jgi:endonuclease/exonuclease/phosphatase family metal-dependent hydrolase
MLNVVTYNILFGRKLDKIIPWIKEQKTTDVMCFQEFPKAKLTHFYKALSADWGHRSTPSFIFKKKIFHLVMIYRKKSVHLVKSETLLMGIHPIEKRILKNPMEKSCLMVTFRIGRKTVTVANTHLVFLAANRARYKQVKLIAETLSTNNHASIITGDFNLHTIRPNKKLIKLMNTYDFHTSPKRLTTHRLYIMKHQLDYVFTSKCKLVGLETERIKFSDHYPIISTIAL